MHTSIDSSVGCCRTFSGDGHQGPRRTRLPYRVLSNGQIEPASARELKAARDRIDARPMILWGVLSPALDLMDGELDLPEDHFPLGTPSEVRVGIVEIVRAAAPVPPALRISPRHFQPLLPPSRDVDLRA